MHSHNCSKYSLYPDIGLNPCFNGRCTRTLTKEGEKACEHIVLILVLMEDALALTGAQLF